MAPAISIELTAIERSVLVAGLNEWGGPASCTDALAVAMGFAGVQDLHARRPELVELVRAGSMTPEDRGRAILATEIVFVSDLVGAGAEWSTTTGLSDAETLDALRGVQRKLPGSVFAVIRGGPTS